MAVEMAERKRRAALGLIVLAGIAVARGGHIVLALPCRTGVARRTGRGKAAVEIFSGDPTSESAISTAALPSAP